MGHNVERETQSQARDLRKRHWLYLGASLLGAAALVKWVVQQTSPMRATAQQTAAKAELEARLGVPMKHLRRHEMMALDCFISPDSLDITIEDIGGLDGTLKKLVRHLHTPVHPALLDAGADIRVHVRKQPQGILLYGPPGTGKTMIVKALAKSLHASVLAIKPSDVQSRYYGETKKAIAGVFDLASRLAKPGGSCCIIFIDEVETLLGRRSYLEHEVPVSMKDEWLTQWDDIEIDAASRMIILGATNRPQQLCDTALRRFTVSHELTLPDVAAREEILSAHLKRHCRQSRGRDAVERQLLQNGSLTRLGGKRPLQWIAEQTEGFSGADLHELAVEAAQNSVESVMPSFRQQVLSGHPVGRDPDEHPTIGLPDFVAALGVYQPTQQKAASFQ